MRLTLLAFLAVLLLANCNRKVAGPAADVAAATGGKLRVAQVLRAIDDNRSTAEWMDAKAKVDLQSSSLNIGGTAYLRLHRDEAIWISVKKFGFEGARALIRPDSFFLYNRLENDYIAEPLSYVEEKYKVPARFDLLQEIFFGNAVFLTKDLAVDRADNAIRLIGTSKEFAADYRFDPATYRPLSMELQELGQDRMLTVTNGDYAPADGLRQSFPRTRNIVVDGGDPDKQARMQLEFTDLSFQGPVEMPFSFR